LATQFVGRAPELSELDRWLEDALEAERTIGFVAGEAGSGKTTLIREFARRAQERIPGLVFAFGDCDGQARAGDPYLPFREIFSLLTGNTELSGTSSELDRENFRRVQAVLQSTGRVAAHYAPALIEMLVPGGKLITRTGSFLGDRFGWSKRIDRLLGRAGSGEPTAKLDQAQMYEQFTNYIAALSDQHPLLIVLDDLQWADSATLGLCFHLARRLSEKPVLLLVTYRPHDLAPQADGSRHEILKLEYELSRIFGKITIDLDEARLQQGRELVDQLIDREPNLLGNDFRDALHEKTGGSALFTVELVTMLKDRGVLIRDHQDRWIQSGELAWSEIPPRVEGIIAERLNRLSAESMELLRTAATEGEEFTAEVAACAAGWGRRDAIRHLSETLSRREKLVTAIGVKTTPTGRASLYRFEHALFRQQLVATLDAAEQCYLHEAVADCLPKVYGPGSGLDQQLASHLLAARLDQQALPYLIAAGQSAMEKFANREALDAFERALTIIEAGSADTIDGAEIPRLYRRLADVRLRMGLPELARDAVNTALEIVDGNDVAERARLLCIEGNAWRLQNDEQKALNAYETASRICAPDGEVPEELSRVWIETGIGRMWAHYFMGDTGNLEKVAAKFLTYSEALGSQEQQAILTHGKLLAHMRRHRFSLVDDQDAIRMADELLGSADATGLLTLKNQAVFVNGLVRLFSEDWDESREQLTESLKLSERIGDALGHARALAYLTVLERRRGNNADSLTYATQLKTAAESSQQVAYLSVAHAQIGWWEARNNDFDSATTHCEDAVRLWSERPMSYPLQWLAHWPLLYISLNNRDSDKLHGHVRQLMREDQQPMPDRIANYLLQTNELLEQGEREQAFSHAVDAVKAAEDAGYY
jgi:tetratricopeptide (TPR) repeat protein